jgi:hypothetical protein
VPENLRRLLEQGTGPYGSRSFGPGPVKNDYDIPTSMPRVLGTLMSENVADKVGYTSHARERLHRTGPVFDTQENVAKKMGVAPPPPAKPVQFPFAGLYRGWEPWGHLAVTSDSSKLARRGGDPTITLTHELMHDVYDGAPQDQPSILNKLSSLSPAFRGELSRRSRGQSVPASGWNELHSQWVTETNDPSIDSYRRQFFNPDLYRATQSQFFGAYD